MKPPNTFPYKLYLVLSQADCKYMSFLTVAKEAILGGVDVIQLREKNDTPALFIKKARQLKELTDTYNVPLIINDNLEVAKAVDAEGIHVGVEDRSPTAIRRQWGVSKYIGYSIEHLEQLENTQIPKTDYLGISPVYKTATKTDTITEWGLQGIATIRERTNKPLVAIGNVQVDTIQPILQAGADCIAVVSAICGSNTPQKAAYQLKNEILK